MTLASCKCGIEYRGKNGAKECLRRHIKKEHKAQLPVADDNEWVAVIDYGQ